MSGNVSSNVAFLFSQSIQTQQHYWWPFEYVEPVSNILGNAKKGNIERTKKRKCLRAENQAKLHCPMIFKLFPCVLKFSPFLMCNETYVRQ